MSLTRRTARPLLAAVFITGGLDTLADPGPRVKMAESLVGRAADALETPLDTEQLVMINAGVQVAAGGLLAAGRVPRLAALALAGSIVPTTLAGHRFWAAEDPSERTRDRIQFFKNLGLLGGLILAAFDRDGSPSLGWRARRRGHAVAESAQHMADSARRGRHLRLAA